MSNMGSEPWRVRLTLRDKLAEALGETERGARWQLWRILEELGGAACVEALRQTLEVERNGGMLTRDGSRKRTRGGIFFALCKQRLTEEQRHRLFPTPRERRQRKAGGAIAAGSTAPATRGHRDRIQPTARAGPR